MSAASVCIATIESVAARSAAGRGLSSESRHPYYGYRGAVAHPWIGRLDLKLSSMLASIALVAGTVGFVTASAAASEAAPIVVLSAVFGPAKLAKPVDFTERLAETCGPNAVYCQAFCSRAAVGRPAPRVGLFMQPRSICRVTYRCGGELTRVTEADENDTFNLSCRPRP